MKTFKANNSNESSRELFEEKVKFNTEAYSQVLNNKGIVEFNFFEKIRYGHVNTKNIPVIPNFDYMQPILVSNQTSGMIFDFCVYGIEQILKHFNDCLRYGNINQDLITTIQPINSFVPPQIAYKEGLTLNFDAFNEYLEREMLNNRIAGFESYVKLFMDYYKLNHKQMRPMTLATHCLSRFSSPLETGLAVQFYETAFDDDQSKYDLLISSPNFNKYLNACRNFGFSVVKNTPNMVIFDINSAANITPLEENNISSIESLFESRYKLPAEFTIMLLKEHCMKGYNSYVENNKVTLHAIDCIDNLTYRKNILPYVDSNNNNYIINNIINIYITFRYYEEQDRMSLGKFNQIKNNLKYFQKRFDNESVMGYINDEFQSLYKTEPDNYAAFIKREEERETQRLEDETQADLSDTIVEISGPTTDRSSPGATGRGTY